LQNLSLNVKLLRIKQLTQIQNPL